MRSAKLSSKSQIVIPAEIRRELGLNPGDRVRIALDGERIVVTKEDPMAALERLRSIGSGRWREVEEEIERSRGEWEEHSEEIERLRDDSAA